MKTFDKNRLKTEEEEDREVYCLSSLDHSDMFIALESVFDFAS